MVDIYGDPEKIARSLGATRSQARTFVRIAEEIEPEISRALLASLNDLYNGVDWRELIRNLEDGNTEGAIQSLHISSAAYNQYSAAETAAFALAGYITISRIVRAGAVPSGTRFDVTARGAELWIRNNVAGTVAEFVREQDEVARITIAEGFAAGKSPRSIATDLVGRSAGTRAARSGGVLGLDTSRAERLRRVTEGMKTPEGVQSLVVTHRDGTRSIKYKVNKATENRILSAYDKGEAVPEAQRIISERQYSDALLRDRAKTISETESANAVLAARDEGWRQLIESGDLSEDDIVKTWRHNRGATANHRADHLAMSGRSVVGMDSVFEFSDGVRMKYAHDPAGGAKHNIRCWCSTDYSVKKKES